MSFANVDLPLPLAPRSAMRSSWSMRRLMSRRMGFAGVIAGNGALDAQERRSPASSRGSAG